MQEPISSLGDEKRLYREYYQKVEEEKKCKLNILLNSQFIEWINLAVLQSKKVIYSEGSVKAKANCVSTGRQLKYFFQLIKEYADRNYMASTLDGEGMSYNIDYKGTLIKVGYYVDDEMVYFARRTKQPVDSLIPFERLKGESLLYIDMANKRKELLELYNFIRTLKLSGFSDEDIKDTTEKALKYVK